MATAVRVAGALTRTALTAICGGWGAEGANNARVAEEVHEGIQVGSPNAVDEAPVIGVGMPVHGVGMTCCTEIA